MAPCSILRRFASVVLVLAFVAGCAGNEADQPNVSSPPDVVDPSPIAEAQEYPPDLPTSVGDDEMVLGDWVCEEGSEQEIAFRQENGDNVFQSYLEGRPMSSGSWQWHGNALSISGTGGDYRFERVSRVRDQLTLDQGPERWVCSLVTG